MSSKKYLVFREKVLYEKETRLFKYFPAVFTYYALNLLWFLFTNKNFVALAFTLTVIPTGLLVAKRLSMSKFGSLSFDDETQQFYFKINDNGHTELMIPISLEEMKDIQGEKSRFPVSLVYRYNFKIIQGRKEYAYYTNKKEIFTAMTQLKRRMV